MTEETVTRKLAAIFYADVAGYSRLTGADEEGTHRTVADYLDAIAGAITNHGGRVVHYAGDAVLADFNSVVAAVRCAVDVQKSLAARNANIPDDRKVQFRIGVNLGDVIVDRDDIYGNGVNVAARLEGLAEPGGICVSGSVLEQVQDKIDVKFEDMGPQEVKNIAKPVQAYRVVLEKQSAAMPPLTLPDKPSIAVLPFENMSGDPEQEFFADGMAEDIITSLSRYRWFFVIARSSSFTYKGRSIDAMHIAQELGVRYVLEGSVRKAGSRMRVTAQLIDASNGIHIWAERYDRQVEDIFDLQDEMTEAIVTAIEPELGATERGRAKRKPPDSLDAWDLYQRGLWYLFSEWTREGLAEARRCLQKACALDPNFADAYAEIVSTHVLEIVLGFSEAPEGSLARASDAAKKAVTLDTRNPVARYALGRVHILRQSYDSAIAEMEAAIALNVNFDRAYYGLGMALLYGGQAKNSLAQFERSIRLNPRSPISFAPLMVLGRAYAQLERYEDALQCFSEADQRPNATMFWPPAMSAAILGHLGQTDQAHAFLLEAKRREPALSADTIRNTIGRFGPHSGADRIFEGLRKAGMTE